MVGLRRRLRDLEARVEALEAVPDEPVQWKPLKHRDWSGEPLDVLALARDASADYAYWSDDVVDAWSPNGYL